VTYCVATLGKGTAELLVFAGVFQCLVIIMVAVYIQSRTDT
jgi:hypothetical protein